jgi:hypothetical protein
LKSHREIVAVFQNDTALNTSTSIPLEQLATALDKLLRLGLGWRGGLT